MSINIKAKQQVVNVGKYSGEYRFVMIPVLYNKLQQSKVVDEAALRSGMTPAAVNAAWIAIGEVIKAWATEGHSVAVPGLGTMRFGVRATSVANVEDVSTGLITSRRVIFTPSVDIKKVLAGTSISITCYDKDGKVVKQTHSDAEVEDDEDIIDGGGNGNSGSAGGDDSGTNDDGGADFN